MKNLVAGILSLLVVICPASAYAQRQCSVSPSDFTQPTQPAANLTPLTSLIGERLSLMTDVARAKWNSGSAIEDPDREQQLLTEVVSQAQVAGVPAGWTQHFFRLQIEAAKEVQYCLFAQWAEQKRGPFPNVPDLKTEIRPKLDHLTSALLDVLSKEWPALQSFAPAETENAFPPSGGAATAIAMALLPLKDGSLVSQESRAKR